MSQFILLKPNLLGGGSASPPRPSRLKRRPAIRIKRLVDTCTATSTHKTHFEKFSAAYRDPRLAGVDESRGEGTTNTIRAQSVQKLQRLYERQICQLKMEKDELSEDMARLVNEHGTVVGKLRVKERRVTEGRLLSETVGDRGGEMVIDLHTGEERRLQRQGGSRQDKGGEGRLDRLDRALEAIQKRCNDVNPNPNPSPSPNHNL